LLEGTPEQERRLAKWALELVGETVESRMKDLSQTWTVDERPPADSRWYEYSIYEHNTCVQFAYESVKVYLGHDWIYRYTVASFGSPTGYADLWGADVYKGAPLAERIV